MTDKTCQLIYSSRPNIAFGSAKSIVEEIIPRSNFNNLRNKVTGILIADDEFFIQLLEGERQDVSDTFLRIAQDHRHCSIALLSVADATERLFPNWSMTAIPASEARLRLLAKHRESANFEPNQLDTPSILQFVMDVSRVFRSPKTEPTRSVVYF